MGNRKLIKFKVGQFLWITLISFFSYNLMFSVEAFRAPLIVGTTIISIVPIRYLYLRSIDWEKWTEKDRERSIDLLRELLICFVVYLIVFLPEWWFTSEFYIFFGEPQLFKLKNFNDTDYHTVKNLNRNYGILVVLLISCVDNWLVFAHTHKKSKT